MISPYLANPSGSGSGGGGGGTGTVTSATATAPLRITSDPAVTPNVTFVSTDSGNKFIGTPADGSAGIYNGRALVAADIPSLSGVYLPLAGGNLTGDFSIATNKFTVASASGNTVVAGTLGVSGATTVVAITASGLVTGSLGLSVTGAAVNLNVSSNFAVNIGTGTNTQTVTIGNSANAVTVSAPATFGAAGTGLAVTNNATVGGTLGITGATTCAAVTASGIITMSQNGAASASAVNVSGSAFTGGSGTTTFPLIYVSPTGTTGATTWSTAGTYLGFNAVSGFTGNFIDCHLAGAASVFSVNRNGTITGNSGLAISGSSGVTFSGSNTITLTTSGAFTATGASFSVNASSNFNVNLCTGTSTGTVAVGGGSGSVSVASTTWNVTTAGAASGFTTIANTGTIYSSGGTIGSPTFALTDAASITIDLSKGNSYSVTLGGNRTLANPTNAVAGTAFRVSFKQDGTGGRTMSFGANYDTAGYTALTGTASKIQEVYFFVVDSTHIRVLSTNSAEFTN